MDKANTHICPYCYGHTDYIISAAKDNELVRIYQCRICGREHDEKAYRYNPQNCPGHQWEFSHRVFNDNPFSHEINMVFTCDRCGAERIERQDLKKAGLSGRVEIEDPRVSNTLLLNKSTADRFLDLGDELNEFWG